MRKCTTFRELVLRHEDRLRLLAGAGGTDPLHRAATIILRLHEGETPGQVASALGVTKGRVLALRQRFLRLGLGGLAEPAALSNRRSLLPPGRQPAPETPSEQERIAKRSPKPEKGLTPLQAECLRIREETDRELARPLPAALVRRLRAVRIATDPTLSLSTAARRAGVGKATMSLWWRTARQNGVHALLQMPAPTHLPRALKLEELPGLSEPHLRLLQMAGVDSVPSLARQHPAKLLRWLEEVNCEERHCRELPTEAELHHWIALAKGQPA